MPTRSETLRVSGLRARVPDAVMRHRPSRDFGAGNDARVEINRTASIAICSDVQGRTGQPIIINSFFRKFLKWVFDNTLVLYGALKKCLK